MSWSAVRMSKREMIECADSKTSLNIVRATKERGNSTLSYLLDDGSWNLQYQRTTIVTEKRDGSVALNSGGYQTTTTKAKMNEYLPQSINVHQEKYVWYVDVPEEWEVLLDRCDDWVRFGGKRVEFEDGMQMRPSTGR